MTTVDSLIVGFYLERSEKMHVLKFTTGFAEKVRSTRAWLKEYHQIVKNGHLHVLDPNDYNAPWIPSENIFIMEDASVHFTLSTWSKNRFTKLQGS